MIKVIAIRKRADGTEWENEWMRGIATPEEANRVMNGMRGQDGIIDGYWDDEEPAAAPIGREA